MQKYLPDDLNPKIKEQLDSEMGEGAPGAAPQLRKQPSNSGPPPAAKPKAAGSGKKKAKANRAPEPAQAAAPRGDHADQHAVVGKKQCRTD